MLPLGRLQNRWPQKRTQREAIEVGGTPVIQASQLRSFGSCAMNLPTTNGLPSSRS
jgi:hypothetical protein